MAWNLLSFRTEFLSIDIAFATVFKRTHRVGSIATPKRSTQIFLSLISGDSHGKDGRRSIEDGEGQRSQIR